MRKKNAFFYFTIEKYSFKMTYVFANVIKHKRHNYKSVLLM